jgi:hypothetical protein
MLCYILGLSGALDCGSGVMYGGSTGRRLRVHGEVRDGSILLILKHALLILVLYQYITAITVAGNP